MSDAQGPLRYASIKQRASRLLDRRVTHLLRLRRWPIVRAHRHTWQDARLAIASKKTAISSKQVQPEDPTAIFVTADGRCAWRKTAEDPTLNRYSGHSQMKPRLLRAVLIASNRDTHSGAIVRPARRHSQSQGHAAGRTPRRRREVPALTRSRRHPRKSRALVVLPWSSSTCRIC